MLYKSLFFSFLASIYIPVSTQFTQINDADLSVLVETDFDQSLYFNHKVNKKETLYRIAKVYQVTTNAIYNYNQFDAKSNLLENSLLKIPLDRSKLIFIKPTSHTRFISLKYKIQSKDNLYGLSRRKLLIDKKILKKLNPNIENQLNEGTLIDIGYYLLDVVDKLESEELENPNVTRPVEEIFTKETRGIALSESRIMGEGRLFALHNEAKMESMIEIINPILNKRVLAKVIGRIPPIYEKEAKVLVSAEVSRQIGALGKRFFVNIRYR